MGLPKKAQTARRCELEAWKSPEASRPSFGTKMCTGSVTAGENEQKTLGFYSIVGYDDILLYNVHITEDYITCV